MSDERESNASHFKHIPMSPLEKRILELEGEIEGAIHKRAGF